MLQLSISFLMLHLILSTSTSYRNFGKELLSQKPLWIDRQDIVMIKQNQNDD